MINVIICGANGKMGHTLTQIINNDNDVKIACGVDLNTERYSDYPIYKSINEYDKKADVIIDFSHPSCLDEILDYAVKTGTPAVLCTTGLSKEQRDRIDEDSAKVPLFFSANMSLGVNLIISLAKQAAKILQDKFDIEIVEKHHNLKIDAPSGTALAIADAIADTVDYEAEYVYDRHSVRKKRDAKEIGIHAVRGGNIVGEHTVIFAGMDEVVEINHQATSKDVFAVGAVSAAKFLANMPKGLYDMSDLIKA